MITLVKQSHEIMFMSPASLIEQAGRTCYKSEDRIGCTNASAQGICENQNAEPCLDSTCEHHSSLSFIKGLIKRGHHAMLEHSMATVRFITNRGVTHEMVRHRLCAFAQESTRYVNYGGKPMQFIIPSWWEEYLVPFLDSSIFFASSGHVMADVPNGVGLIYAEQFRGTIPNNEFEAILDWLTGCLHEAERYNRMLERGMKPEQARGGLPNDLKTEIVVSCNFREWMHIFNLRALGTTGKPHPQMQALMLPVLEGFAERVPSVFAYQKGDS